MTLAALLRTVTPPGAWASVIADTGQHLPFHPDEAVFVAGAAPKRQREFALGRVCARAAMLELGHGETMLARKKDGAPLWPAGIVGSISHTDGHAVALAAPAARFHGLGVDIERQGRVVPDLYRHLFDAQERGGLENLPGPQRDALAALMFSAKEACCKIWLGRHGGPQPFAGIRVTMAGADFMAGFPARDYPLLKGRAVLGEGLAVAVAWDAA